MNEPTDTTIKPSDFGDEFDAWISGATLAQKSIDIYGNPGLIAEYEQLERDLKVAKAMDADEEASMADSRVGDIEERMVALYQEWQASKSTWTVRGIPRADARELAKKFPDLPLPELAEKDADDPKAKAKHAKKVAEFDANADGRNYSILERTVVKIEFANGKTLEADFDDEHVSVTKPAITAAQLATLRTRLGEAQFLKLIRASQLAATSEPVIPAPFLRSSSKGDPT